MLNDAVQPGASAHEKKQVLWDYVVNVVLQGDSFVQLGILLRGSWRALSAWDGQPLMLMDSTFEAARYERFMAHLTQIGVRGDPPPLPRSAFADRILRRDQAWTPDWNGPAERRPLLGIDEHYVFRFLLVDEPSGDTHGAAAESAAAEPAAAQSSAAEPAAAKPSSALQVTLEDRMGATTEAGLRLACLIQSAMSDGAFACLYLLLHCVDDNDVSIDERYSILQRLLGSAVSKKHDTVWRLCNQVLAELKPDAEARTHSLTATADALGATVVADEQAAASRDAATAAKKARENARQRNKWQRRQSDQIKTQEEQRRKDEAQAEQEKRDAADKELRDAMTEARQKAHFLNKQPIEAATEKQKDDTIKFLMRRKVKYCDDASTDVVQQVLDLKTQIEKSLSASRAARQRRPRRRRRCAPRPRRRRPRRRRPTRRPRRRPRRRRRGVADDLTNKEKGRCASCRTRALARRRHRRGARAAPDAADGRRVRGGGDAAAAEAAAAAARAAGVAALVWPDDFKNKDKKQARKLVQEGASYDDAVAQIRQQRRRRPRRRRWRRPPRRRGRRTRASAASATTRRPHTSTRSGHKCVCKKCAAECWARRRIARCAATSTRRTCPRSACTKAAPRSTESGAGTKSAKAPGEPGGRDGSGDRER